MRDVARSVVRVAVVAAVVAADCPTDCAADDSPRDAPDADRDRPVTKRNAGHGVRRGERIASDAARGTGWQCRIDHADHTLLCKADRPTPTGEQRVFSDAVARMPQRIRHLDETPGRSAGILYGQRGRAPGPAHDRAERRAGWMHCRHRMRIVERAAEEREGLPLRDAVERTRSRA